MKLSYSIFRMKYLLLFMVSALFFDLDDNSDPWLRDLCIGLREQTFYFWIWYV